MNLVSDRWLPVSLDGRIERLSLLTALVESHKIDYVVSTMPGMEIVLLRQLLLPVMLDVYGHPAEAKDWSDRRHRGSLDVGPLESYLGAHAHRFEVFGETAPFAQVAGLQTTNRDVKPSSLLVPNIPAGNNVPLFGSRSDADPPGLTPGDAIMGVLYIHCFDTAAIKSGAAGDPRVVAGKTTGNPTGPLGQLGVVYPTGPTLFDTLLLNLPCRSLSPRGGGHQDVDAPQWRRPPQTPEWSIRRCHGILDLFTWQSRRIRLIPSVDEATGATVVRQVVVCAGDRLLATPDYEPHTAWRLRSGSKPMDPPRPLRHRSGRAVWRGLDALLAGALYRTEPSVAAPDLLRQVGNLQAAEVLADDYRLGIETVGLEYGNQSAVIETAVHDSIPMPLRALSATSETAEKIVRIAVVTDELVRAIDVLEGDLNRACGGELAPWDKGQRMSERLVFRLDAVARRLLAGLQREPERLEDAMRAWANVARSAALETADELLARVPPAAIVGRQVNNSTYRAAGAELSFLARLRKVLPPEDSEAAALVTDIGGDE